MIQKQHSKFINEFTIVPLRNLNVFITNYNVAKESDRTNNWRKHPKKYVHNMVLIEEESLCRLCNETASQIILECKALGNWKLQYNQKIGYVIWQRTEI